METKERERVKRKKERKEGRKKIKSSEVGRY